MAELRTNLTHICKVCLDDLSDECTKTGCLDAIVVAYEKPRTCRGWGHL